MLIAICYFLYLLLITFLRESDYWISKDVIILRNPQNVYFQSSYPKIYSCCMITTLITLHTLTKGCCSKLFVCLSCEKITNFTTFKHDIDTTQTADVILVLSSIFRCYNYRVSRLSNIIQCNKKLMLFEFLALYHSIYLCH